MVQPRSIVKVADNTGAKTARVFKVLGGSKKRYAGVGEIVVVSIQAAEPRRMVKKKEVHYALVLRQRNAFRRKDGSYIRFDDNAVIILQKGKTWEPKGTRIFGPVPREIGEKGFQQVISMAPEVL